MSGLIVKPGDISDALLATGTSSSRLRRWLNGWKVRQVELHRQWRYFSDSSRRGVSYRMWSRHGAYIQMHQKADESRH